MASPTLHLSPADLRHSPLTFVRLPEVLLASADLVVVLVIDLKALEELE